MTWKDEIIKRENIPENYFEITYGQQLLTNAYKFNTELKKFLKVLRKYLDTNPKGSAGKDAILLYDALDSIDIAYMVDRTQSDEDNRHSAEMRDR